METIVGWGTLLGVLTVAGFSIGTYKHVGQVKDDTAKKIDRNYDRLDEVKKEIKTEFVSQLLCNARHAQSKQDMIELKEINKEIQKKVECIPVIKMGLDLLLKKNGLNGDSK